MMSLWFFTLSKCALRWSKIVNMIHYKFVKLVSRLHNRAKNNMAMFVVSFTNARPNFVLKDSKETIQSVTAKCSNVYGDVSDF